MCKGVSVCVCVCVCVRTCVCVCVCVCACCACELGIQLEEAFYVIRQIPCQVSNNISRNYVFRFPFSNSFPKLLTPLSQNHSGFKVHTTIVLPPSWLLLSLFLAFSLTSFPGVIVDGTW